MPAISPISQQLQEMQNEINKDRYMPQIRTTKLKKDNIMRRYSLQRVEKQILKTKYIHAGFSYVQAEIKIQTFSTFLTELVQKLKAADKDEKYIQIKLSNAFEDICRKIEAERG